VVNTIIYEISFGTEPADKEYQLALLLDCILEHKLLYTVDIVSDEITHRSSRIYSRCPFLNKLKQN
jgi:hypothetical protein